MKSEICQREEIQLRHQQELQQLLDTQHNEMKNIIPTVLVTGWVYNLFSHVIEWKQTHVPADWFINGSYEEQALNYTRETGLPAYTTAENAWRAESHRAVPQDDFEYFRFYDDMVEGIGCSERTVYFYDEETKVISANVYWLANYVPFAALCRAVKGYPSYIEAHKAYVLHTQGGRTS